MVDDLEQVRENCLVLLNQGVSVEDCLSAHPRLAEDLEPLLRTAFTVQGNLTTGMPQIAKVRARTVSWMSGTAAINPGGISGHSHPYLRSFPYLRSCPGGPPRPRCWHWRSLWEAPAPCRRLATPYLEITSTR